MSFFFTTLPFLSWIHILKRSFSSIDRFGLNRKIIFSWEPEGSEEFDKTRFDFFGKIATNCNSNMFRENVINFLPRCLFLVIRTPDTVLAGRLEPFSVRSCFWWRAVMMIMRNILLFVFFMISSSTGQFLQCHVMYSIVLAGSLKLAINPAKMPI